MNPRIHLTFITEIDLAGEVVLYTVVGVPVEGPMPNPYPERSFMSLDDLEVAMAPTLSAETLARIRESLTHRTQFILEVDAEQAAAVYLFSDLG